MLTKAVIFQHFLYSLILLSTSPFHQVITVFLPTLKSCKCMSTFVVDKAMPNSWLFIIHKLTPTVHTSDTKSWKRKRSLAQKLLLFPFIFSSKCPCKFLLKDPLVKIFPNVLLNIVLRLKLKRDNAKWQFVLDCREATNSSKRFLR